jgi:acyl-CoA synthetase (AMP-forming)/AMP-acid ligase II
LNLATNLESAAFFFPDHAAISEDGIEITYAELNDRASLVASGLADMGVNPGDYIALCA